MSTVVYSTRFLQTPGLTSEVAFTVPAGYLMVLRDMDATFTELTPSNLEVGLAGGALIWVLAFAAIETAASYQWRGRQVLVAGEQLVATCPTGTCDFIASGYLLTLP